MGKNTQYESYHKGRKLYRKLFQERTVKTLGKSCTTRGFK